VIKTSLALFSVLALGLPRPATAQQKARSLDLGVVARTILDASYLPDGALAGHRALLERAMRIVKDTPLAETVVQRWVSLARSIESPWNGALPEGFTDTDHMHGLARLALDRFLHDWYEERGNKERAKATDTTGWFVRHALAVGPFGGEGSAWHGVRFPIELEGPQLDHDYAGRFGKVRLRTIKVDPGSAELQLAPETPHGRTSGCQYAIVQVHSGSETPCYLELTCSGSYELWWNDARVASVNRRTFVTSIRGHYPAVLRDGWNRIMIKTTSANVSTCTLRLVDANGDNVKGLAIEEKAVLHKVADASDTETKKLPGPFATPESWLEALGPNSGPLVRALIGNLRSRVGKPDEGLALVRKALSQSPQDTTLIATQLEAWRMARHLPSDVRRSHVRKILSTVKTLSHRHLRYRRILQLFQDDQREEAMRECKELLARHPKSVFWQQVEYELCRRWHWKAEARIALEKLRKLAPDSNRFLLDWARLRSHEGNPRNALEAVEAALQRRPGSSLLIGQALSLSRTMGDSERVRKYTARMYRKDPTSVKAKLADAALLLEEDQPDKALVAYEKLLSKRGKDPELLEKAGDVALEAGDAKKAIAYYKQSLAQKPDQHTLRRFIWNLRGQASYPECRRFTLDTQTTAMTYKKKPDDDASSSTLVLDQMVIRVYPDASIMEETQILRRINDRKGVEEFEQARGPAEADELIELRTVHPDGKVFYPHRVAGTFSMPRLEPGSFIEEHYRNFKPSPKADPIDFIRFVFQSTERPYRFSRLVVLLPKDVDLGRFVVRNFPMEEVERLEIQTDEGPLIGYVFLREHMKRIIREQLMPSLDHLIPWVTFGRDHDSTRFVRSQREWFDATTHPFLEIREKAAELCSTLESDVSKARAIHDFVHALTPDASMRPGSSAPMSVLLKREGDRFPLQLALLRAAGVKWTPVLIHPLPPELDPEPEPMFGAEEFFTRRAAIVHPADGDPFWIVQGTPRHFPFAKTPAMLHRVPLGGSPCLELIGDVGVPGVVPGGGAARLSDLDIDAELKLDGDRASMTATIGFGEEAGYVYKEIMRAQNESAQKYFARRVAGTFFRGFTLRSSKPLDLGQDGAPLRLRLELSRERFLDHEGARATMPLPFQLSNMTRSFGGRAERIHPIVWERYLVRNLKLTIDPGDHKFVSVPKGLRVRRLLFDYGLSYDLEDHKLTIERHTQLRPGEVPTDRYREFLDLCRKIDERERERIVIER